MMYINQNSFALNELIMSPGGIQSNQTATYNLLQPNTATTSTTTNYQSLKSNSTLYHSNVTSTANINSSSPQQQQQQQQQNRSTSVSSTGSTSSSTSSTSVSSSTPSTSPANQFSKLPSNNTVYQLNFGYYSPATIATSFNTSTSNQTKPFVASSQLLTNATPLANTLLTTPTTLSATSAATYNTLNEKFMYRPKSDTSILSNLNSYQLNVLTQKNPNQYHFNTTQTTASIVNNDSNLNSTNLFLFNTNTTKNAQQNNQNHYNYEPIAYLPTSTDLFFTSPSLDQFSTTSYLTTPYLTAPPTTAPLTQPNLTTKSLISTFNTTKTPFTTTSIGINIKKRKRRFKKPIELRKVLPKNSLMLLHEYRPNVEYRFVCQSGPIHRPVFTMCVEINEHKFEGEGKTKKEARMAAADKAIEFLLKNPEYIQKSNHSTTANLSSQTLNIKSDNDANTSGSNKLNELSDDELNENEDDGGEDDNDSDDADAVGNEHQNINQDDNLDSINYQNTKRLKTNESHSSSELTTTN